MGMLVDSWNWKVSWATLFISVVLVVRAPESKAAQTCVNVVSRRSIVGKRIFLDIFKQRI